MKKNLKDLIDGAIGYKRISDFSLVTDRDEIDQDILQKDGIIISRAEVLNRLFEHIKYSKRNYVLITQYNDYHVCESHDKKTHVCSIIFKDRPSCIKKWYSPATTFHHPDLIQIPLGFGIHWKHSGWPDFNEQYRQWLFDNSERLSQIEKDNETLYCNFAIDQNRSYRASVLNEISNNKYYLREHPISFPDYCEEMARYKYVISPPGNGIETHRNWEALYVGCIPIVLNSIPVSSSGGYLTYKNNISINIYEKYDLPFLVVDNYSKVNKNMLKDYLEYYNNHDYKYEQMTLSYWENMMRNDLKN